ncbi:MULTISPECIES: hypothetical protein [unclassified Bosea (in: a-proteobacteria)]|uniref:hypothetical protein n=1 Tax=unclassified Bosea (in: a-proteobacteria) TaxID=2653178 RepID=UPI000F7F40A8|nr:MULTISPECIES: hypothetical protein [unclassified Bosea (in: a-proteobacteria)]
MRREIAPSELPLDQTARIQSYRVVPDTSWLGEFAVLAVVCLLALNSGLYNLFPPMGWVDPGLYIFNFQNLVQNIADYGANYHSTRVPFIFLGWLSYRIFEPALAQQVLVNLCYLIGLGSLLCVARASIPRQSSRLIFVLALALSPTWIRCFVEGYVDGLASAFALLGIAAALSRHLDGSEAVRGLAAGAAAGFAVATHPVPGIFASAAIFMIFLTGAKSWRRLSIAMLGAFCGGLGSLVLLGLVSFWLGGPFLFLLPGAEAGTRMFSAPGSSFALPVSVWLPEAPRAVLVPLTLATVLAAITLRRAISPDRRVDGFLLISCIALGILALAEFHQRGVLQFRFYASYLLMIFVPLCALLIGIGRDASARRDLALAAALALALIPVWRWDAAVRFDLVWALLLGGCLLALIAFVLRRARLGLLAAVSALSLATATDGELARILTVDNPAKPRLQAQFAAKIRSAVIAAGVSDRRIVTWFNRESAERANSSTAVSSYGLYFAGTVYKFSLFDGATASMGWDLTSLGFEMPKLEGAFYRQIAALAKRPAAAVLLCVTEAECREGALRVSLEPSLIVSERLATRIEIPDLPIIHLIIIEMTSRPTAGATPG